MYVDKFGLIVQKNGDSGDTAQRTGMFFAAQKFREILGLTPYPIQTDMANFETAITKLVTPQGLVRSPTQWNDPKDTSRDQATPMIIACGLYGMTDIIQKIMPKPYYFFINKYQNSDVASPENMTTIDRALKKNNSTWLGDLVAYFGVKLRCKQASKNADDVGDDLNCLLAATFSYLVKPTKQSAKNLKYYLENRPPNFGVGLNGNEDHVLAALYWYFRPETGGNRECAEIWRDILPVLRQRVS